MALSNYLTHSHRLHDPVLRLWLRPVSEPSTARAWLAIVLTIWIVQLMISPIWLKHFRFGPAEWLWRSLTYWRPQPMRLKQVESAAMAA